MQKPHYPSFFAGIASGFVVLLLIIGGMHLFFPAQSRGRGANLARMAQRMGITQDQLQQELNSGKTMQEIAQEHGVQFGGGFGGGGAGRFGAGNGSSTPDAAQGTASSNIGVSAQSGAGQAASASGQ